jgi:hypothetical protein
MNQEHFKSGPAGDGEATILRTRDGADDLIFEGKTEAGKKKIINWATSVAGPNLDTLCLDLQSIQAHEIANTVSTLEELWFRRGTVNGIKLVNNEINRIASIEIK